MEITVIAILVLSISLLVVLIALVLTLRSNTQLREDNERLEQAISTIHQSQKMPPLQTNAAAMTGGFSVVYKSEAQLGNKSSQSGMPTPIDENDDMENQNQVDEDETKENEDQLLSNKQKQKQEHEHDQDKDKDKDQGQDQGKDKDKDKDKDRQEDSIKEQEIDFQHQRKIEMVVDELVREAVKQNAAAANAEKNMENIVPEVTETPKGKHSI